MCDFETTDLKDSSHFNLICVKDQVSNLINSQKVPSFDSGIYL